MSITIDIFYFVRQAFRQIYGFVLCKSALRCDLRTFYLNCQKSILDYSALRSILCDFRKITSPTGFSRQNFCLNELPIRPTLFLGLGYFPCPSKSDSRWGNTVKNLSSFYIQMPEFGIFQWANTVQPGIFSRFNNLCKGDHDDQEQRFINNSGRMSVWRLVRADHPSPDQREPEGYRFIPTPHFRLRQESPMAQSGHRKLAGKTAGTVRAKPVGEYVRYLIIWNCYTNTIMAIYFINLFYLHIFNYFFYPNK